MVTTLNQYYSTRSGRGIGGGALAPVNAGGPQAALPSWVPPVGFFADVPMLNAPLDVAPSIYVASAVNTAFDFWGGSAVVQDYSPLGAQVYHSAGHETAAGQPNIQMTLICDFSTLRWSCVNVPVAANASGSFSLTTGLAPDGTIYSGHTYLGLQEFPIAWGGVGPKGTLLQMLTAGSSFSPNAYTYDLNQQTNGYAVMPTVQPGPSPSELWFFSNSRGGNYPVSCIDYARQGWWLSVGGQTEFTLFISKTGAVTRIPTIGGNNQNSSMVLIPKLNLLINLNGGYSSGAYASSDYRQMMIRDLTTNVNTPNVTTGPMPSLQFGYDGSATPNYHRMDVMGLDWVDELNCIVGIDQTTTPPTLVTLTPPATNPKTNPWVWGVLPIAHWSADTNGYSTLRPCNNGYWSKFRWVPSIKCFVLGASYLAKPQVIRVC